MIVGQLYSVHKKGIRVVDFPNNNDPHPPPSSSSLTNPIFKVIKSIKQVHFISFAFSLKFFIFYFFIFLVR